MTTTVDPAPDAAFPAGLTVLPLARIARGANPRRYFNPHRHTDLVESLRLRGMLQPILVRPSPGGDNFILVAGERRYIAALEAFGDDGMVPAVVRELTDQEALEAAIDENDNREDASETEQADAAVRVLAACGGDHAEAARRMGWSTTKLDRRLALATLSDAVKAALDERRIKLGHAELLAAVPPHKQDKALDTILTAGLDVGKTRELLMRVTQSLAAATFDRTECATCQFNSQRQCALFETHVDDGHCTNAACYQLKTEAAAEQRRREEEAASAAAAADPANTQPESGAAGSEKAPATEPGDARSSTPEGSPGSRSSQGTATPKVTAASMAQRARASREEAWRSAVRVEIAKDEPATRQAEAGMRAFVLAAIGGDAGFDRIADLAHALEVDLREHWRVHDLFLGQFGKDELKFIARECGLIDHLGEKAFGKLLKGKPAALVSGMLAAPGFDWAGRLPSAITLDGAYGPPPDADATPAIAAEPTVSEEV